jgi:hypothetical protein
VALVNNHQPQVCHWGENSRTGANNHSGVPAGYPSVLPSPLRRGQTAVQDTYALTKTTLDPLNHLRGKRYLGYQQDDTRALGDYALSQSQVDLGLAAAGDPPKLPLRKTRPFIVLAKPVYRQLLLLG